MTEVCELLAAATEDMERWEQHSRMFWFYSPFSYPHKLLSQY